MCVKFHIQVFIINLQQTRECSLKTKIDTQSRVYLLSNFIDIQNETNLGDELLPEFF